VKAPHSGPAPSAARPRGGTTDAADAGRTAVAQAVPMPAPHKLSIAWLAAWLLTACTATTPRSGEAPQPGLPEPGEVSPRQVQ
jgi:hypothetical protein